MARLAPRQAGDGAQWDKRAGEAWTGPNRWRDPREYGVPRTRGWHARVSQQQRDAVCVFVAAYYACEITYSSMS